LSYYPSVDPLSLRSSSSHSCFLQLCSLPCGCLLRRPPEPTLFPYTTLFRSYRGPDLPPVRACSRIPCSWRPSPRTDSGWVSLNRDRKSTRLNSSHGSISYAVFCLKKKNVEHRNRAALRGGRP